MRRIVRYFTKLPLPRPGTNLAGNHRKVVELIGQEVRHSDNSEDEEFQRVVEAALLADGSPLRLISCTN